MSPTPVHAADHDPAADTARLRLAVVRLFRLIRKHGASGVTPTQLSALATLRRHGPMQPAQLADHEGLARSSVTRSVRRLEEAGYVQRSSDPEDGRCAVLALTSEGHDLLSASRERAEAFLDQRIAALDAADQARIVEVADLLERLAVRP